MTFQIKCRNMECSPDLEQAIRHKITRFDRLVPDAAYLELELKQHAKAINGGDKEAEIILDIPGVKPVMRFSAQGDTYVEVIDRVLDKLDEKLSQERDKMTDHSYRGPSPKERLADEMNKDEL